MRACSTKDFLENTKNHTMKILKDDGEYRHLVFSNNGSSVYKFNITTWPGYLCISGDMGCCVFSRLRDMFEFFRTNQGNTLERSINPAYWAEKLQATVRDGVVTFNHTECRTEVLRYTRNWLREHYHQTTKQERRWLMEEIRDEVLVDIDDGSSRDIVMTSIYQSTSKVNTRLDFQFTDFFERNFDDFSYHFIWCCYAIAWGINIYDETKKLEST